MESKSFLWSLLDPNAFLPIIMDSQGFLRILIDRDAFSKALLWIRMGMGIPSREPPS